MQDGDAVEIHSNLDAPAALDVTLRADRCPRNAFRRETGGLT
jgi:hypothetical protein